MKAFLLFHFKQLC